jgi:RNA polymerase sigma-70 factor (ECF subfamily)
VNSIRARFEQAALPHLDAAFNLARWLLRHEQDAEDVVQEAFLRAFRAFDGFRGGDARAWLLAVVRNTCFTYRKRLQKEGERLTPFDEEAHGLPADACDPPTLLLRQADRQLLRQAVEELPVDYREVLVLRELEGLSYKEIAGVAGIPLGTVMSRLTRARQRLQASLARRLNEEALP